LIGYPVGSAAERRDVPGTFANMSEQGVGGTFAWRRCAVEIAVPDDTHHLAFGCFLSGSGEMWADDLILDAVEASAPVAAPAAAPDGAF
jgi:hypothetical protein